MKRRKISGWVRVCMNLLELHEHAHKMDDSSTWCKLSTVTVFPVWNIDASSVWSLGVCQALQFPLAQHDPRFFKGEKL